MEDVPRNTVIRVNATDRAAKSRNKVILWSKFGPVDLNDKNYAISTEMFDYYHNTVAMKTEGGVCPGHDNDLLLRKKPLNLGELNLDINTNSQLLRYMQDKLPIPAALRM